MTYEAFYTGHIDVKSLINKIVTLVDCEIDREEDYKIISVSNRLMTYKKDKYVERTYIMLAQCGRNELKRQIKFFLQREKNGFDSSDLWNLDVHLTKLMIQYFKKFEKACREHGWPTMKKGKVVYITGDKIVKQILKGFKLLQKKQDGKDLNDKELNKVNRAFNLFKEHFNNLWT